MNDALPAGTRLRGGALLIEEVLRREPDAFLYRAYDVPARHVVTLFEHFPPGAQRRGRAVVAPGGWSAQGLELARAKFLQNRKDALFSFTENDTIYTAHEYSVAPSISQTTASLSLDPAREITREPAGVPVDNLAPHSPSRRRVSFNDIGPDALRGALQGALAGGAGGVLLGTLAALFGDGDFTSGALRGLWALPIGALSGGLLGALRALPSDAPPLATASARTREQQLQSTLAGAGKGALLGFALGVALLLFASGSGLEMPAFSLLRAVLLFALCGAFGGGIVGFIRIAPRDRSRR